MIVGGCFVVACLLLLVVVRVAAVDGNFMLATSVLKVGCVIAINLGPFNCKKINVATSWQLFKSSLLTASKWVFYSVHFETNLTSTLHRKK